MKKAFFHLLMLLAALYFTTEKLYALESSEYFEVLGTETRTEDKTTYTVVQLNVKSGANITNALNRTFAASPKLKIIIPPGKYTVNGLLRIVNSHTWLYMPGVTIDYDKNAPVLTTMLRNGASDEMLAGYSYTNITIEGSSDSHGAFRGLGFANEMNNMLLFIHAKELTIRYLDFTIAHAGHMIEAVAVKDVTIDNCTFTGRSAAETSANEAIQLDVLDRNAFEVDGCTYDNTLSSNIFITNNKFVNTTSGCGTHNIVTGTYFDNVNITGNSFTGMVSHAVAAANYKNSVISNNTITSKDTGIYYYGLGAVMDQKLNAFYPGNGGSIADLNTTISSNTIAVAGVQPAIRVVGGQITTQTQNTGNQTILAGDYTVKGLSINNNVIKTTFGGILCNGLAESEISGNQIVQTADSDIAHNISLSNSYGDDDSGKYDFSCTGVTVSGNVINNSKYQAANGITVIGGGGHTIEQNSIKAPHQRGIYLKNCTQSSKILSNSIGATGAQSIVLDGSPALVQSNKIAAPGTVGIGLYNTCPGTVIKANGIANAKKSAIQISNNSETVTVQGNKITSPKDKGILLDKSSAVIQSNSISAPGTFGIGIYNLCPSTTVKSNTVANAQKTGIYVSGNSKTVTIQSNKITSPKDKGIALDKSSATIQSNVVSDPAAVGIGVYNACPATLIKANGVANAKKTAIQISNNSKTVTVQGNKITSPKDKGIVLDKSSAVIDSNSISSPATVGVGIYNGCASTVVKGNAIGKAGTFGIYITDNPNSVTIQSNTVSAPAQYGIYMKNSVAQILSNKLVNHVVHGIYLQNCTKANSKISKNTVQGAASGRPDKSRSIYIIKSKLSSIDGNKCANYSTAGIDVDADSKNIITKDNSFATAGNLNILIRTSSKNYPVGNFAAGTLAVKNAAANALKLTWKKVADADGYVIYRAEKGGSWSKIKAFSKNTVVTMTDSGLPAGKTYYYRLYAFRKINGSTIYSAYQQVGAAVSAKAAPASADDGRNGVLEFDDTAFGAAAASGASGSNASSSSKRGSGRSSAGGMNGSMTHVVLGLVSTAWDGDIRNAVELAVTELADAGQPFTLDNLIFEADAPLTAESLSCLQGAAILAVDAWDIGELEAVLPENSLLMYLETQDGSGFVPGNGDEAVSDAYFRVYGTEPTANALNAYWAVKAFAEYCESGSDDDYSHLEENFSGMIGTDR